jgi:hypothetical protein
MKTRWLAIVMLLLLAGCAGNSGTVQGSGGDRNGQGHVGWRLPL